MRQGLTGGSGGSVLTLERGGYEKSAYDAGDEQDKAALRLPTAVVLWYVGLISTREEAEGGLPGGCMCVCGVLGLGRRDEGGVGVVNA